MRSNPTLQEPGLAFILFNQAVVDRDHQIQPAQVSWLQQQGLAMFAALLAELQLAITCSKIAQYHSNCKSRTESEGAYG